MFIKQVMTFGVKITIHLENVIKQETNNKNLREKNSSYKLKNTLSNDYMVKEEIKSAIIEKIKHDYYRLKSLLLRLCPQAFTFFPYRRQGLPHLHSIWKESK